MKKQVLSGLFLLSCFCCQAAEGSASTAQASWILDFVEPAPNFPSPGILFQWYGPLLRNPQAFHQVIQDFAQRYQETEIDAIVGLDSRGFIFGAALAYEMGVPFVLARKPGKLPGQVVTASYQKEYGTDRFEMEISSLNPGDQVLIIDDIIATGGTALAACQLVEKLGAQVVEIACLIEITQLKAREKIPYPVFSLLALE